MQISPFLGQRVKLRFYVPVSRVILEFLHCTPVGSKPGSYMPNMAMPYLNKI